MFRFAVSRQLIGPLNLEKAMRIHTNDLISAFSFPIDALLFSEMH